MVKHVANKAQIAKPISPYDLRHILSVNCTKQGIFGKTIQTLLGYDMRSTTTNPILTYSQRMLSGSF